MSTVARSSTSTSSTAAITNYSSPSANTILSNPGAAGISSAGRLAAASPEQAYGMSSVRSAINQVGTGSLVSPAGGLLEGNVSPLSVSPARYSANGHGAPLAAQTSATVTTTEHSNANSSMAAAPARTSSSAAPAAAQPRNPLIDLIETERAYVDDLAMVIKKVAAAWSRSNFPPPALDKLFRAIEAVYRIDKQFLVKLNDIGPSPSSPKALGDLLMRWVDELDPAYTKYVAAYHVKFDYWKPVQSNPNLAPVLQALPPPISTSSASTPSSSHATLDILFALPLDRLEYYKRLYAKLLKSTQPGKSDHSLLVTANEKLDSLLEQGRLAATRAVGDPLQGNAIDDDPNATVVPEANVAPRSRQNSTMSPSGNGVTSPPQSLQTSLPVSQSSTGPGYPRSAADTSDRSTPQTTLHNVNHTPSDTAPHIPSSNLLDIETRLDTSQCLDIFTMRAKKCKLQISPPGLAFQRSLRQSGPVQTSFIPSSDPSRREVFSPEAFIYLLSDLFLICEAIPLPLHAQPRTNPNADMWLKYPPLAAKHLRCARIDDQLGTALEVEIMRKEKIVVICQSREKREEWLSNLSEAIAFQGPSQGLRVNTSDLARSGTSVSSVSQASSSGMPHLTPYTNSSSGQSSFAPSLPPLPLSATQATFSSPTPSRSQTPVDGLGRPLDPRHVHSTTPDSAQGRISPFSAGSGPSSAYPMQSYPVSQQAALRPLPSSPHGMPSPGQGQFHRLPNMQSLPPGSIQGHGQPYSQDPYQAESNSQPPSAYPSRSPYQGHAPMPQSHSLPPLPPGSMHPTDPSQRFSSTRSHASQGSRSSRSNTTSPYPGGGPMPSLPFKDPSMASLAFGMPPSNMHSGYLTSPEDVAPAQSMHRSRSADGLRNEQYRMPSSVLKESLRGNSMPSAQSSSSARRPSHAQSLPGSRMNSGYLPPQDDDDSPPSSPKRQEAVLSQLAAQMKCKVFIQQAHGQWKSLGTARLKLYLQTDNRKQLVVEDNKQVLISTIVLDDGVERVGKTGVAVEISDNGSRTGIVYMLQMKTEQSATGLFQQLLLGSSRASAIVPR